MTDTPDKQKGGGLGEIDELCVCGHGRSRHAAGHGFCMGARMESICVARCTKFTLDVEATNVLRAERKNLLRVMAKIDRARPFVDDSPRRQGFPASSILTMGYLTIATSQRPDLAEPWLDEMLADARRRHSQNKCADPFYQELRP